MMSSMNTNPSPTSASDPGLMSSSMLAAHEADPDTTLEDVLAAEIPATSLSTSYSTIFPDASGSPKPAVSDHQTPGNAPPLDGEFTGGVAGFLPVEILDQIMDFVAGIRIGMEHGEGRAACQAIQPIIDLYNCAKTCKLWASVALPCLYRNFTPGAFTCLPPQPYQARNSYSIIPYSEYPFFNKEFGSERNQIWELERRRLYWRTVGLSLDYGKVTETNVFASPEEEGADWGGNRYKQATRLGTLYPYISYLDSVDNTDIDNLFRGCEKVDFDLDCVWRLKYGRYAKFQYLKSLAITQLHPTGWSLKVESTCEMLSQMKRLENLWLIGDDFLVPEVGKAIASIRPSLIDPTTNKTIDKRKTFALKLEIKGGGGYDPEDVRRFLMELNQNSVTLLDLVICNFELKQNNMDIFLHQARTLKCLRLQGFKDTSEYWLLWAKLGKRGCRLRALELPLGMIIQPPLLGLNALRLGLFTKLKHLTLSGFSGIFDSLAPGSYAEPSSLNILLRMHASLRSDGTRKAVQYPIRTLRLTTGRSFDCTAPGIASQIGVFLIHISSTLTTLEIWGRGSEGERPMIKEGRKYDFVEALRHCGELRKIRLVGYFADAIVHSLAMYSQGQGQFVQSQSPGGAPAYANEAPVVHLFYKAWRTKMEEVYLRSNYWEWIARDNHTNGGSLQMFLYLEKLRVLWLEDYYEEYVRLRNLNDTVALLWKGGWISTKAIEQFVENLPRKKILKEHTVLKTLGITSKMVDWRRLGAERDGEERERQAVWIKHMEETIRTNGGEFVLVRGVDNGEEGQDGGRE